MLTKSKWRSRFAVLGCCAGLLLCLAAFLPGRACVAATVTLSDPVPTLLNGIRITTDANRLAAGARPVEGVAADGVSRIVIAVTAASAGQRFTFTIYNDQSAPSASTAEDGGLAAAGSTTFASTLATAAVTTNKGAMAFAIYRAPLDFARPNGGDDGLAKRSVSIHWASGTAGSGMIPLTILRPPVVLVHGLWSGPDTWDNFTPLLGDPRFSIQRANYLTLEIDVSGSPVSANALGFAFNARYVAPQIDSFVNGFKTGRNPANLAVAAVQADVVAHSMGGDIARTMPIMAGFGSATTFRRGNVHKLITVDTPHLGSPLATDLFLSANECVRNAFFLTGFFALPSVTTSAGLAIDGAMGDLEGDGNGGALSPALQAMLPGATQPPLQAPLLPTAFVAAIAGPDQLGGLDKCKASGKCTGYNALQAFCKGKNSPLADNMTAAGWKNNVMMGPSDALVPFPSEYNAGYNGGIDAAPGPLTAIHSSSLEQLGLGGPGVLQPQAGAPGQVIALLNTWIAESPPFVSLR